jgi:cytoskeletal protein CcmA (bactofilin family)
MTKKIISENLVVPSTSGEVAAVIDQGCEFEGKLCFHGVVRINGVFKGQIFTPDTLIIGEGARVYGDVSAGVVIVSGEFEGNVDAKQRLEIHRPAILKGDIHTPSLRLEEGAVFEGNIRMVPIISPQ